MKRLIAFAFTLAAFAPVVTAQTSGAFTGKWEGTVTMKRPDGTSGSSGPIVFNLTQKGDELTGTAGPPDQQGAIEKGMVADGKATFQVQPGPLYKFTLSIVQGRLQGEMTGERDGVIAVRGTVDAAKPAAAPNAQPQERKEIAVAEAILRTYVGEYEISPGETVAITFENGSLWGQPVGSNKRQLFAESDSKFFLKSSPTELTFQKDASGKVTGLLMKRGSQPEMPLKKVK